MARDPSTRSVKPGPNKNTIDLQWKLDAKYNASPCESKRKAAGARTMASNGKNNARSKGNNEKSGA
jgi:hypothetical protein